MTRIGLIRHGSTQWNKEGRAQGHTNNPLNEEGMKQAQALTDRLLHEDWEILYSSDLLRAKQTAEVVHGKLRLADFQYDKRLREMHGGQIEGTTEEERIRQWGAEWRSLDLGIEKAEEGVIRGGRFIEEIAELHKGKNVLIVSHGAIIRNTLKGLMPELDTKEFLKNTSLTIISKLDDQWNCELYNCTRHLNG